MISLRYALTCALLFFSTSSSASLFFSEYVEGSSFNKALEIFNTGEDVDLRLGNYVIDIYVNGATTPRHSLNLEGIVEQQGTFVVAHSSADTAVTSIADLLLGSLSFNGDDAITLVHDGVIVDRIGQVGIDPGSEWGTGVKSTQNNTLRRNINIFSGDMDVFLAFDPSMQWQGFDSDDFSGLGSHSVAISHVAADKTDRVSVPLPGSGALIAAGLLPLLMAGALNRRRTLPFQHSFA